MNEMDEMLTPDANGYYKPEVYERFLYHVVRVMRHHEVCLTDDEKRLVTYAFTSVPARDAAHFIRDNLHYLVTKWLLMQRITGSTRWPRV